MAHAKPSVTWKAALGATDEHTVRQFAEQEATREKRLCKFIYLRVDGATLRIGLRLENAKTKRALGTAIATKEALGSFDEAEWDAVEWKTLEAEINRDGYETLLQPSGPGAASKRQRTGAPISTRCLAT